MKLLPLVLSVCFCLSGCAGISLSKPPGTPLPSMRGYTYVAEIPVIRPSTRNTAKLRADALALVKKHKKGNVVAYLARGEMQLDQPITDEVWLDSMKSLGRWEAEGWDFDPGTTAQVYMEYLEGVGGGWGGKVVFVKDGKKLGMRVFGGNLYSYYRDMAKLGIYIP